MEKYKHNETNNHFTRAAQFCCCFVEMEKSILNSILALCLLALKAVVDPEANKFLKLAIATYGKKKQKRGGSKSGPTERA